MEKGAVEQLKCHEKGKNKAKNGKKRRGKKVE